MWRISIEASVLSIGYGLPSETLSSSRFSSERRLLTDLWNAFVFSADEIERYGVC